MKPRNFPGRVAERRERLLWRLERRDPTNPVIPKLRARIAAVNTNCLPTAVDVRMGAKAR